VKKKVDPSYEEHNYSYGEEDDGTDHGANKDPYLKAASKEFEAARKAFEIA